MKFGGDVQGLVYKHLLGTQAPPREHYFNLQPARERDDLAALPAAGVLGQVLRHAVGRRRRAGLRLANRQRSQVLKHAIWSTSAQR